MKDLPSLQIEPIGWLALDLALLRWRGVFRVAAKFERAELDGARPSDGMEWDD